MFPASFSIRRIDGEEDVLRTDVPVLHGMI
jgi:hypothetical protein